MFGRRVIVWTVRITGIGRAQLPRQLVKLLWNEIVGTGVSEKAALLLSLDVPPAKQAEFAQYLAAKYGTQFTEDTAFTNYVRDIFQKNKTFTSHAERFGGEINLSDLLLVTNNSMSLRK